MAFYYSKKPLTGKQRELVSLTGFNLDWFASSWLESLYPNLYPEAVTIVGHQILSEFIEFHIKEEWRLLNESRD
jgi:hypothetical protein